MRRKTCRGQKLTTLSELSSALAKGCWLYLPEICENRPFHPYFVRNLRFGRLSYWLASGRVHYALHVHTFELFVAKFI